MNCMSETIKKKVNTQTKLLDFYRTTTNEYTRACN